MRYHDREDFGHAAKDMYDGYTALVPLTQEILNAIDKAANGQGQWPAPNQVKEWQRQFRRAIGEPEPEDIVNT